MLAAAFPRAAWRAESDAAYTMGLMSAGVAPDEASMAVRNLVHEFTQLPTVADVLDEVQRIRSQAHRGRVPVSGLQERPGSGDRRQGRALLRLRLGGRPAGEAGPRGQVRSWTHAEEEALRYLAPRLSGPELAVAFGRSHPAIRTKACRLRIELGRKSCATDSQQQTPAVLRRVVEIIGRRALPVLREARHRREEHRPLRSLPLRPSPRGPRGGDREDRGPARALGVAQQAASAPGRGRLDSRALSPVESVTSEGYHASTPRHEHMFVPTPKGAA